MCRARMKHVSLLALFFIYIYIYIYRYKKIVKLEI